MDYWKTWRGRRPAASSPSGLEGRTGRAAHRVSEDWEPQPSSDPLWRRALRLFPAAVNLAVNLLERAGRRIGRWSARRKESKALHRSRRARPADERSAALGVRAYSASKRAASAISKPFELVLAPLERKVTTRKDTLAPAKAGIGQRLFDAALRAFVMPLFESEQALRINHIAQLIVVWLLVLGVPAAVLGIGLMREFRLPENRVLKDAVGMRHADVARSLSQTGRFHTQVLLPLELEFSPSLESHPDLRTPPLYPLLLSGVFGLAGPEDWATVLANTLCCLILAWLTYYLALKFGGRTEAFVALGLCATNYTLMRASFGGSPAVLTALLLILLLCLHAEATTEEGAAEGPRRFAVLHPTAHMFVLGIVAAMLCLSSYAMLALALPLLLWHALGRARSSKAGWLALAAFLLAFCPWLIRNAVVSERMLVLGLWKYELLNGTYFDGEQLFRHKYLPTYSVLLLIFRNLGGFASNLFESVVAYSTAGTSRFVAFWAGSGVALLGLGYLVTGAFASARMRRFYGPLSVGLILYAVVQAARAPGVRDFAPLIPILCVAAGQAVGTCLSERLKFVAPDDESQDDEEAGFWETMLKSSLFATLLRIGLCLFALGISAVPFLSPGSFVYREAARHERYMRRVSEILQEKKLGGKMIATDRPEFTAWRLNVPSMTESRSRGDNADMADIRDQQGLDVFARASFPSRFRPNGYLTLIRASDQSAEMPIRVTRTLTIEGIGTALNRTGLLAIRACRALPEELEKGDAAGAAFTSGFPMLAWGEGRKFALAVVDGLTESGRFDLSLAVLDRLVALNRFDPAPLYRKALALARRGDGDQARQAFLKATRMGKCPIRILGLAHVVSAVKPENGSREMLRRATQHFLTKSLRYSEARLHAIELLAKAGDSEAAAAFAEEFIRQRPWRLSEAKMAKLRLGKVFHVCGSYDRSVAVFEDILKQYPLWDEAHLAHLMSLMQAGQFEKAEKAATEWAKIDPKARVQLPRVLAEIYLGKGDFHGAVSAYREALAVTPRDIVVLNNLAVALQRTGRLGEAETTARLAYEIDPGSPALADTLAWILYSRRQFKEAFNIIAPFEHHAFRHPVMGYHCGAIRFAVGDYMSAVALLEDALSRSSSSAGWRSAAEGVLEQCRTKLGSDNTER